MHNKGKSLRKNIPEKQQSENGQKKNQGKQPRSSSKKPSSSSNHENKLSTPEKHIHFESKCKPCNTSDNLEASSSFPRESANCGKHETSTGVSIKDVGLDIAGFLIEEEIRQNKEKLKLEIIRQIALSRELDKHLERQRHIMNNYICNNTLDGTKKEFSSLNANALNDNCNCMVCQEAAMENVSTSTSTCVEKSGVSEKSLQVNGTGSVSSKTIPQYKNNFTQPSSLTKQSFSGYENSLKQSSLPRKDVSCQGTKFSDMCQQCNEPNKNEQTNNIKSANNYKSPNKPLGSVISRNAENSLPLCIEGYIEDYSCTLDPPDYCDVCTAPAIDSVSANMEETDEFNKQKGTTTEMTDQTLDASKPQETTNEMTDQTLNNLNNLLNTPLDTIEPQTCYQKSPCEDATEMILNNIKSIIHEYMENINFNCNKCQLEASTSKGEKKSSVSNSNEDVNNNLSPVEAKKSDIPTKCENDGTHIDIVMQFCESHKKKRAILEIEPCFDARSCMKYTKKKCAKKKVCEEPDSCTQCSISSCSLCESQYSNISNTSRKFSPYPLRNRTTYRKSSKPNLTCRPRKQIENYCKQKKCAGVKARKNMQIFSNHSVEVIKVNRCSKKPVYQSSSSDSTAETLENYKTSKLRKSSAHGKKGLTFCSKKSTVCSYVTNLGGNPIEQSKQSGKFGRKHNSIPVKNHELKSHKKIDHRHKSKIEHPLTEISRKDKERGGTTVSVYSLESSNLDETSYREIQMNERSKVHSKKEPKSRTTSNTCTTVSLNLEDSNFDIPAKCSTKREMETTLDASPSDIIPLYEQWSMNRFQHKNETLASSNRPRNTNHLNKTTNRQRRKSVKTSKNVAFDRSLLHASSSSDPSIYKSTTIDKHRNKLKTAESDSSIDVSEPIENIKTYTKINSDGGVVIISPLFEARKMQLMKNWLSYMNKVQAKENVKATSPTLVAIEMPTSSNYVLPHEDSDQQLEYLKPKPCLSNELSEKNATNKPEENVFENFKKKNTAEKYNINDSEKTVCQLRNSSKWKIFNKKDRNEMAFEEPVKRTIKQSNKDAGLGFNKSKSEVLNTESTSSSEYIVGSSLSDSTFDTTSESILDVNENNHDELIEDLICPNRNNFKGKYFDVSETDRIINRAFYIQDIFVKLASTDEEKEYWRDTVLRAMKNIVTKTS